jgi:MoxR-like ATPase
MSEISFSKENASQGAVDIQALNAKIKEKSAFIDLLNLEVRKAIIGQNYMVERLLLGLLSGGHILLEGVPGLAKTLAIKTLATAVQGKFSRIQFTPDLLPADVVGTMIYNPKTMDFSVKHGPIFANFVLADEINRSPAKVQSALLEAMQEKQVTLGEETSYWLHKTRLSRKAPIRCRKPRWTVSCSSVSSIIRPKRKSD